MRPPRYRIEQSTQFPLPLGGLDSSASEDVLPRTARSRRVRNVLLNRQGKLVARGSITNYMALTAARVDVLMAGWQSPTQLGRIMIGRTDSQLSFFDIYVPSSTVVAMPTNTLSPATARLSETMAVLGGYAWGSLGNRVMRWDGGNLVGSNVIYLNGPLNAGVFEAHLTRLFVGHCAPTGGPTTTSDGAKIVWSDPGGPLTDTAAVWQDDVTGLPNQIVLDDTSDQIIALKSWNGRLYIFRQRSVWVLTGSAPANFAVRKVLSHGCANAASVCVTESAIYWLNGYGSVVRYDGGRAVIISDAIIDSMGYPINASITGFTSNDHILLVTSAGTAFLYYVPANSWSEVTFDPAIFSGGAPTITVPGQDGPYVVTTAGVASARNLPLASAQSGAETGGSGVAAGVPIDVYSGPIQFAAPTNAVALKRLMVDYYLFGVASRGAPSILFSLIADDGSVVWTKTVPGQLAVGVAQAVRQREVFDLNGIEATSLTLRAEVVYSGSGNTLTQLGKFELLNAEIEFSVAEQTTG